MFNKFYILNIVSEFTAFFPTQNLCCTWWGQRQKLWTGIKLDRRRYLDCCLFSSFSLQSVNKYHQPADVYNSALWDCTEYVVKLLILRLLSPWTCHESVTTFRLLLNPFSAIWWEKLYMCINRDLPVMTFDAPTDPCRLSLVNCINFVMLDFRVQPKEIRR